MEKTKNTSKKQVKIETKNKAEKSQKLFSYSPPKKQNPIIIAKSIFSAIIAFKLIASNFRRHFSGYLRS